MVGAWCSSDRSGLLELDRGPGALELCLGLVGVFLGDPLEHRLRCAVDEVLGLLQAEAREGADLLDDVDLLLAGGDEDHVELVLLLGTARGGLAATGARSRGHRYCRRSGRGDAELVLERLEEVVE